MARSGTQFDGGFDDAGADIVHRQRDTDTARGADQDRALRQGERLFRESAPSPGRPCRPCLPVQALALPELTTTAWARPLLTRSTHTFTGAAQAWLVVNMPATVAGTSETMSARSRLLAFVGAFAGAEAFDVAKDPGGTETSRGDDGTLDRS